jgi:hypothetical protein
VDKSWLVLGPGRTGSLTIVRSIYSLYNYNFNIITYAGPREVLRPIKLSEVVHAHDLTWLDQVNEDTEVIISTRNPVESALSWCIVPEIGTYHFYPHKKEDMDKLKSIKIKKFYLSPSKFLSTYTKIVNFYKNLQIKDSYKILDYSEWSDDPSKILSKLGYNGEAPIKQLTAKNPGSHRDWIENWEEISRISESLPKSVNDLINTKYPQSAYV